MYRLTAEKVAKGLILSQPGRYVATEALLVSAPVFPAAQPLAWKVFVGERPCVLSVQASDVTLDLDFKTLSNSSDQVGGLVLICVGEGCVNVRVENAVLGRCAVGVFFGRGCVDASVSMTSIADFAEKAVLAYSPKGLTLADVVVGENLSQLSESQESYALRAYGDYVTPAGKAGWAAFHDNLPYEEQAHVCGICVVPDMDAEAPYPVSVDTGEGVTLERVQVAELTMYFRNHSLMVSVLPDGAVRKARGRLGEPLADWYKLRWFASAKNAPLRYYPPLEYCEQPRSFITDAGGFQMNTGTQPAEDEVTAQVVGVDRNGSAVRGVQALLFVGCGTPTLTAVTAARPVLKTLTPRVLPCPVRCQVVDLAVSKAAAKLLVLAAPLPDPACCSRAGFAGQLSQFASANDAQPIGAYIPAAAGTLTVV